MFSNGGFKITDINFIYTNSTTIADVYYSNNTTMSHIINNSISENYNYFMVTDHIVNATDIISNPTHIYSSLPIVFLVLLIVFMSIAIVWTLKRVL